jgi:hypothetical protein
MNWIRHNQGKKRIEKMFGKNFPAFPVTRVIGGFNRGKVFKNNKKIKINRWA